MIDYKFQYCDLKTEEENYLKLSDEKLYIVLF